MKCAAAGCSWTDVPTTNPCSVCGRQVLHMCSNDIYDGAELSKRFCSRDCVRAFFAAESDSQELTPSSTSGISHSSQDVLIDLAQGDPEAVEEHPNDVSLVLFANTSCSECSICSQRSGISESFRSTLS
ncbi:hypothetical protein V7S43_016779 [Phytophthora oleae]|uniref:MYM-type domain-containing protein n=1 Tax=Phytophthora oleae TaxID=2107226 RepID=A0ABD3EWR6_9STRA